MTLHLWLLVWSALVVVLVAEGVRVIDRAKRSRPGDGDHRAGQELIIDNAEHRSGPRDAGKAGGR